MRNISNAKELTEIITPILKKHFVTNGPMNVSDIEELIISGKVYAETANNSLFLFTDRESHYKLTFYLSDDLIDFSFPLEKPTVCEILYKNANSRIYDTACQFLSLGFNKEFERQRLTRLSKAIFSTDSINIAIMNDCDSLMTLLYNSFSPITGCLPDRNDICKDIDSGNFILIKNKNEIVGVIHYALSEKKGEIKHLCVHENYRGLGLSEKLIDAFLRKAGERRINVWVRENYAPAIKAYKKFDFEPDGYRSVVMTYRR